MTSSIFDTDAPHPEPSRLTAFSENPLDRRSEHRPDECVEKALAIDGAHIFAFSGNQVVLKHDGQVLDPLFALYELADLDPDMDNAVLLGFEKTGEPRLAVPVRVEKEDLASHHKPVDARTLYRDQLLSEELLGEFAQGVSLISWNRDNKFCGKCGAASEMRIGGYKRVCPACDHAIFPRTDPVVIMLTIDVGRDLCMLGRSYHFAPGMYSCLAGFVEPGETIENAVRRETFEESAIRVGRVRYYASQPWPMPHSLMIGCYAEANSFEIRRDEQELEDCRWFTREETRALLDMPTPAGQTSPPKGAIAHRLMRDWLEWKR
ncbi:NAD(+) diphosphatase [Rhizobiaceae bacterium n13]|uniref:NAD(+) diphosphatase n=1 Tax=Ferirhizobium litorale TaxID=2927786 RepID=A0AAE3U2X4_9HYPH|nr:NAD(+) diphosphatase [Fererhizobium litorale]MDI7862926.1 NAD(+) diphosphatase [Fererhizobium litorale]MDI7924011.1 NAD(+) diphosphatase [Fererhizobium litorale]